MTSEDYRFSPLVLNLWFEGTDNFLDRVDTNDLTRLRRLARLTRELEAAVMASSPHGGLAIRPGATPEQLYPQGSLVIDIYQELLAELAN